MKDQGTPSRTKQAMETTGPLTGLLWSTTTPSLFQNNCTATDSIYVDVNSPSAQAGDDFAISCVENAIGGTFPTTGRSLGIGDHANNYPFGSVWADGQDYGSGMNPWSINTTPGQGGAGAFVGNPQSDGMGIAGIGDQAFGLYSTSNNFYVNAQAEFTSAMAVGDDLRSIGQLIGMPMEEEKGLISNLMALRFTPCKTVLIKT